MRQLAGLVAGVVLLLPGSAGAESAEDVAREIARITGTSDFVTQIGASMLEPMRPKHEILAVRLVDTQADLTRDQKRELFLALADFDRFSDRYLRVIARELRFDRLVETDLVPLYVSNFSRRELDTVRDFYASPAGRKLLELGPKLNVQWTDALTGAIAQLDVERALKEVVAQYRQELGY